MKRKLLSIFAGVLAITRLHAAPEARNISLKVKLEGKANYNDDAITQTRSLQLSLSLSGSEPGPDLILKWTIYGHARNSHDPVVIKTGEIEAPLDAGKSVELATPVVTINGVREHSVTTGSGRRRKSKKVPASGQEYFGYSVVVMNGSAVVAEEYSHGSLKPNPPRQNFNKIPAEEIAQIA